MLMRSMASSSSVMRNLRSPWPQVILIESIFSTALGLLTPFSSSKWRMGFAAPVAASISTAVHGVRELARVVRLAAASVRRRALRLGLLWSGPRLFGLGPLGVEGLDLGLSPLLCCLLVSLVVRQDGTGWLHGKALWENGQNELILKPFHFQLCWDCSVSKLKLLFLVASAITMPKASQC